MRKRLGPHVADVDVHANVNVVEQIPADVVGILLTFGFGLGARIVSPGRRWRNAALFGARRILPALLRVAREPGMPRVIPKQGGKPTVVSCLHLEHVETRPLFNLWACCLGKDRDAVIGRAENAWRVHSSEIGN